MEEKMSNRRRLLTAVIVALLLVVGGVCVGDSGQQYVEAAGRSVSIDSCLISGTDVVCKLSTGSVPARDRKSTRLNSSHRN